MKPAASAARFFVLAVLTGNARTFFERELQACKEQDQTEQKDCLYTCCFVPSVNNRIFVNIVDKVLGCIGRSTAGQQFDLCEAAERDRNIQEQNKEYLRGCHWQHNMPDSCPNTGTVQIGTFDQILRHSPETNQQKNVADTHIHPDRHNADSPHSVGHLCRPADIRAAQQAVDHTVFLPKDKQKDCCCRRRSYCHRQCIHRLVQLSAFFLLRGQKRKENCKTEGEHQIDSCDLQGDRNDLPKGFFGENSHPV